MSPSALSGAGMVSSVGGRPLFLGDEDDEDEDALHPRAAGPPVAGTSARPSSSTALPQLSVQGSVAAPASSPSQLGKKPPSDHSRSFDNAASQGLYDDFLALDRTITPLPLAPPPTHLLALLPQAVPLLSLGNFVQLVASDTAVPLVPELSGSPGQSLLQRRIDLARLGEAPFREGLSGGVERYQIALEDLSPRGRAELQERMERTELTGEVTVPTWNAATNSFNSLSHTLPFLNRLNPGDAVIQASKHHPSRYHTAMIYHTRSSLARLLASSASESAVPLGPELSISPIRSLLGGLETLPFLATKRRFRIPSCAVGAAVPRIGDTLAWIEMLQLVQPSGNTKGRNSYTIGLVRQNTGAGVIAPSALLASWPAAFGPPCDESRALLEDFLAATEEINHLAGEMVAAFLELGLLPEEKQSSTFQ
ncbi:uncharacterized protein JCM10292_005649, partial [Rhodotorula paludigena]|uniref:uncharacterized protein n=1 Tax=Rhodotorula paludigena TaxID=86838 RepID=UPI00316D6408